ncbi:MAG: putative toxin-antitoxin system toxin component, PIN family [Desulfobacteraceae bacterium]|jgi:putative PIN family toxin of toxin-antitoxin system
MARLKRKLRAVIDTNLFISGLFAKDSVSAQLQNLWIDQAFELVTSVEIIKEVSRVLSYPRIKERFKPKEDNVRRFFRLIFRKAIISKDVYHTDKIVDDPTDNKFLACALEKKADYIVSRDPHLRNLKHFHGIQIVDATTFIEKIKDQ